MGLNERVIHGNNVDGAMLNSISKNDSSNAAKASKGSTSCQSRQGKGSIPIDAHSKLNSLALVNMIAR